jgi:uncharacterized protein (TIGR02453 family)
MAGTDPTTFRGWPVRALSFFEGLEADNSKAYWTEHKVVYERDVLGPMEALLSELEPEFGEVKMFRPSRDTRFSRDKSPYKTAIAARVGSGYVQLSAAGLVAGAGTYHMTTDQLQRYRAAVDSDTSGRALQQIVDRLRAEGLDVAAPEMIKTAPRGYPKDHERVELLRHKGLVTMRSWPPARWLASSASKERVVDVLRSAGPLLEWLDRNVGARSE